jgi:hypothetical protein
MRVAARAWRSLRRLRPEERQILATQVGLEGAEEILQGLGRGEKRLAPVLVLRALEKAKKADPSQLRDLVKGLRDRDKRGTILQKWLDSASEGLDDEGAEVIQEAQAEATSEESVKSPSPAQREKTPPAPRPPQPISVAQPPVAVPVASVPPAPSPAPATKVRPVAVPPENAQPRRASPPLPLPVPVPVPVPLPRPKPAGAGAKSAPQATRRPAPAVPAGEPLAERLHRTDSLMLRFRLLRSGLDRNGGSLLGDLPQLLEAFPSGWARRRALAALLRRRIPADLERALALIDELESHAARRWCLGTILQHWNISTEQQDQLRRRRRSSSSS